MRRGYRCDLDRILDAAVSAYGTVDILAFLASEQGSCINGQIIEIDGGIGQVSPATINEIKRIFRNAGRSFSYASVSALAGLPVNSHNAIIAPLKGDAENMDDSSCCPLCCKLKMKGWQK
ncbi:MAG: hypothetical protein PUE16_07010 [Lactimicrobium massiliense]|nr:hypothetical protein [Lactimicrobium massiliense]MDD6727064.1 hypothetical protein [Lactimicrobium massiliense]